MADSQSVAVEQGRSSQCQAEPLYGRARRHCYDKAAAAYGLGWCSTSIWWRRTSVNQLIEGRRPAATARRAAAGRRASSRAAAAGCAAERRPRSRRAARPAHGGALHSRRAARRIARRRRRRAPASAYRAPRRRSRCRPARVDAAAAVERLALPARQGGRVALGPEISQRAPRSRRDRATSRPGAAAARRAAACRRGSSGWSSALSRSAEGADPIAARASRLARALQRRHQPMVDRQRSS